MGYGILLRSGDFRKSPVRILARDEHRIIAKTLTAFAMEGNLPFQATVELAHFASTDEGDHTAETGNTSVTLADSAMLKMSQSKDYLTFQLFSGINYQETMRLFK